MTDLDENEFRWLPFPMGYEEPAPHAGPVNFDEFEDMPNCGPRITIEPAADELRPFDANFKHYIRGPQCPWLFDMWDMDRLDVPQMQFQAPVHYDIGSDSVQFDLYLAAANRIIRTREQREQAFEEESFSSRDSFESTTTYSFSPSI